MRLQAYLRDDLPNGSCNIEGYIQNITAIQRRRNDINTLTHAINSAKVCFFVVFVDGTLIFANRHTLAIDTRRPNMYRVKLIIPATSHD